MMSMSWIPMLNAFLTRAWRVSDVKDPVLKEELDGMRSTADEVLRQDP